jgi:hypothetical protein
MTSPDTIRWQKPSFEELVMNAEVGGYQAEDGNDDGRDEPLFVGVHALPDYKRPKDRG